MSWWNTILYPIQALPKMSNARIRTKSHFMDQFSRRRLSGGNAEGFRGSLQSFATGKETMPEPPDHALLLITPGELAILAVKFLWNDPERAEQADQRRGNKFARHLRILDLRRAALWTANQRRSDDGIGRFQFDH